MKIITLFLTCTNDKEAEKISDVLLNKRLVVCIKKMGVKSSFLFKKKIDKAQEVLLIMDSVEEKFEQIENEVRKIHSYETFVLVATPVVKSSKGVEEWMKEEIG